MWSGLTYNSWIKHIKANVAENGNMWASYHGRIITFQQIHTLKKEKEKKAARRWGTNKKKWCVMKKDLWIFHLYVTSTKPHLKFKCQITIFSSSALLPLSQLLAMIHKFSNTFMYTMCVCVCESASLFHPKKIKYKKGWGENNFMW